ncbi:MAG TPA: hypothetical protein VK465_14500 [Fibrobacteria bacterium]|nr:hypothetical protein [Fibrobacteria bacterium]
MQQPKPSNSNIAKLSDGDEDLLRQLRAVAALRRWPGDWSNRAAAVRATMDKLVSLLPAEEREMLSIPEPTEAQVA